MPKLCFGTPELKRGADIERLRLHLRQAGHALHDILYGMSVYDWLREVQKERGERENLFILVVFGDLLGVPILPPYYTLRLLPYVVPALKGWRGRLLREKDLTELLDHDLG